MAANSGSQGLFLLIYLNGEDKVKKLVNLTPHVLNVCNADGQLVTSIAPTAPAARCTTKTSQIGEQDGIPFFATTFGEILDLPPETENTVFIVSLVVRQAAPDRLDLASPGELIRDDNGQPKGCKGLAMNVPVSDVKPTVANFPVTLEEVKRLMELVAYADNTACYFSYPALGGEDIQLLVELQRRLGYSLKVHPNVGSYEKALERLKLEVPASPIIRPYVSPEEAIRLMNLVALGEDYATFSGVPMLTGEDVGFLAELQSRLGVESLKGYSRTKTYTQEAVPAPNSLPQVSIPEVIRLMNLVAFADSTAANYSSYALGNGKSKDVQFMAELQQRLGVSTLNGLRDLSYVDMVKEEGIEVPPRQPAQFISQAEVRKLLMILYSVENQALNQMTTPVLSQKDVELLAKIEEMAGIASEIRVYAKRASKPAQ